MAALFIQQQAVQSASATSVTTAGMTTTSGNFLAAVAALGFHSITGSPITDNKGNTWHTAKVQNTSAGDAGLYFAANIIGGAGHTVTFTHATGFSEKCALAVLEFSGIGVNALDQTASTIGNTAPHTSGSVTTTTQAQLLLGFASDSNQQTLPPASVPGFFRDIVQLADGAPEGLIMSYAIVNTAATYQYKYTYENNSGDSEPCGIATFKGVDIAYVQSTSTQDDAAVTLTTTGMTTTSGNCLVVIVSSFTRTFSGSPITDSNSNTWTAAWATAKAACYFALDIVGGVAHTVTVTPPGGSSACAIALAEFSGIDAVDALDEATFAVTTTEPRSSGMTGLTSQRHELLIGGGSVSHLTLIPYSTINGIWTDAVALRHIINDVEGIIVSYRIVTQVGSYSYSWANGVADEDGTGIATFEISEPTTTTYPTVRERIFALPFSTNLMLFLERIEFLIQAGEGLVSGQGSDPVVAVWFSKDGGKTYGNGYTVRPGKMGEYTKRSYLNRIGRARNWVCKIRVSDPVFWAFLDCYVDMSEGTS